MSIVFYVGGRESLLRVCIWWAQRWSDLNGMPTNMKVLCKKRKLYFIHLEQMVNINVLFLHNKYSETNFRSMRKHLGEVFWRGRTHSGVLFWLARTIVRGIDVVMKAASYQSLP